MAAYIVFMREEMRDPVEFGVYSRLAAASAAGHASKLLAYYGKSETLEGPPVDGAVIVEFPTMAEARAWYDSPAYIEARIHRFAAAEYRCVIIEGV